MKLSNSTYDTLKFIAATVIPVITTLWLTVGAIWKIPLTIPIGATMAAVDLALGTLMGIEATKYAKTQPPPIDNQPPSE